MKKQLLPVFILLLLLTFSLLDAQQITSEKRFAVTGYSVNSVGYPSKMVPLNGKKFAFVEYWVKGEGRKYPSHYLQGYNLRFEEDWFKPLNKSGVTQVEVKDLIKMKRSLALVGSKYFASSKRYETMIRFFSEAGSEKGSWIKLSNYDDKVKKGYENYITISTDSSKLLWLGHNPNESGKKRTCFASVYKNEGTKLWSQTRLKVKWFEEKYQITQSEVDKKGNLYLLLTYETPTNSVKDTLYRPVVMRYDYREKKWSEQQLNFPGASIPECKIHINKEGDLIAIGILSDGSAKGFQNGQKRWGESLTWNKIFYKKFDISRELTLKNEQVLDLPEEWMTKYGTKGANFSKSEMLESNGKLFWILEDFYTQTHNGQLQFAYNDVAVVAIDMEGGLINWASSFEKKQRDYGSGRLLSYVRGLSGGKLNFVYLTARGAQGKIACTSFNLADGTTEKKNLVSNKEAKYLFFPKRSAMVTSNEMILMGVGDPVGNDYKLIKISF